MTDLKFYYILKGYKVKYEFMRELLQISFVQIRKIFVLIRDLMAVEVKRKSNENMYGLLTRFKDKVKKGRVLSLVKKSMNRQKPLNKLAQKQQALRRKKNKEQREYLIKIGKIKEKTDMRDRFKRKR